MVGRPRIHGPGNAKGIKEFRRQKKLHNKKASVNAKLSTISKAITEDSTIKVLNSHPTKKIFVERTIPENTTVTMPGGGITSTALIFDPSGSYGNVGFGAVPIAMPDWASYAGIYNQYKVKYIKLTFRLYDTTAAQTNIMYPVWFRYNYETAVTVPTLSGMEQLTRCVKKIFTNDSLSFVYKFYPKVAYDMQNGAILASQGKQMRKQGWTDVNYPPQLYGFQFTSDTNLPANQTIYMDVTYGVNFRYNK